MGTYAHSDVHPLVWHRILLTTIGALPVMAVQSVGVSMEWALALPGFALVLVSAALNPTITLHAVSMDSAEGVYKVRGAKTGYLLIAGIQFQSSTSKHKSRRLLMGVDSEIVEH